MSIFKKKEQFIENELTLKIGGEAGNGIAVSGMILSKLFTRGGLNIYSYSEYPSLIRGGHNTFQLSISKNPLEAPYKTVHLLIALNKETVKKHIFELIQNSLIIYDSEEDDISSELDPKKGFIFCPIPLTKLAKESGADRLMRNTVAIGACIGVLDYDFSILEDLFTDTFASKGKEIVDLNIKAAKEGYDYVKNNFDNSQYPFRIHPITEGKIDKMVIAGNEALSLGAIRGGLKFYAGYPMTPSSSILHYLAANQLKYDIVVKHTEDEISAANMVIGASFAGVRSMTSTSGGGFSLMVESLGLAAITETPFVIVDAQRPGPATGLPTWTGQGDLRFVLHAAQDDFPRIVIAPSDQEECFFVAIDALNLAEKYQIVVIILTDKFLAESLKSIPLIDFKNTKIERGKLFDGANDKVYKRYDTSVEDGVSPRSIPGMTGGIFLANSDEHDEHGYTSEEGENRVEMQNKRMKKLTYASLDLPEPILYGPKKAEYTIVSWGSNKGAILETMKMFEEDGIDVNFLNLLYIHPFPSDFVYQVISDSKNPILVESNFTGQLGGIISQNTGIFIENQILKYDGRPFFPEELYSKIKSIKNQKGLKKWLQ